MTTRRTKQVVFETLDDDELDAVQGGFEGFAPGFSTPSIDLSPRALAGSFAKGALTSDFAKGKLTDLGISAAKGAAEWAGWSGAANALGDFQAGSDAIPNLVGGHTESFLTRAGEALFGETNTGFASAAGNVASFVTDAGHVGTALGVANAANGIMERNAGWSPFGEQGVAGWIDDHFGPSKGGAAPDEAPFGGGGSGGDFDPFDAFGHTDVPDHFPDDAFSNASMADGFGDGGGGGGGFDPMAGFDDGGGGSFEGGFDDGGGDTAFA